MSLYYLGRVITAPKSWTGEPIKRLSKEECNKIYSCVSFSGFYNTTRGIWRITIESGNDYVRYCNELENTSRIYSEDEMYELITTANKLLLNYLTCIKTFIDITSNAISKENKNDLSRFQDYNRELYDCLFGYRFLSRLRNYVIHFQLPISGIKSDANGVKFWCSQSRFLEYDGWSTVKEEIAKLPETIEMSRYIIESNHAVDLLYYRALETILQRVSESSTFLRKLCEKYYIEMLAIGEAQEGKSNIITWNKLPLQLFRYYVEDISHNPSIQVAFDK